MKLVMLHLSDFHIRENDKTSKAKLKIKKIVDSINCFGEDLKIIIVFSGDLAHSGKVNEYKNSCHIFGELISKIKNNFSNPTLLMIPGNHDLTLEKNSRQYKDIINFYKNDQINDQIDSELKLLDNFYSHSHAKHININNKVINKSFIKFQNKKIQFNLVNTTMFSTLEPNDKELHYFPYDQLNIFKKDKDSDLCITVMHHGLECFNWDIDKKLQDAVINDSEILLLGHTHRENSYDISYKNKIPTFISYANEIKLYDKEYEDSYNVMVFDEELKTFSKYIFKWNKSNHIYQKINEFENKNINKKIGTFVPTTFFINHLKQDYLTGYNDFSKYFVFPKLSNNIDENIIDTQEKFVKYIYNNNHIIIKGEANSGKSTFLKSIFLNLLGNKIPLLAKIENNINIKKYIKHTFEENYGDEVLLYDKFCQLPKEDKIILIDDWDMIKNNNVTDKLLDELNKNFSTIILTVKENNLDISDIVINSMNQDNNFKAFEIKPFFANKRNELIGNLCELKNLTKEQSIKIEKITDSLISNNYQLFSFTPSFIVQYTNFFIDNLNSYEYVDGEKLFSTIYEHRIREIFFREKAKKKYEITIEEAFFVFEMIAFYMFKNKKTKISQSEIMDILNIYKDQIDNEILFEEFSCIALKSKILSLQNYLYSFVNNNYLSYFIAKYFKRNSRDSIIQQDIKYTLKNICFGINSDIIFFMSYLGQENLLMDVVNQSEELFDCWDEFSFEKKNIKFFNYLNTQKILKPSTKSHQYITDQKDQIEEDTYYNNIITKKEAFDYDEDEIDMHQFKLARAFKYMEIICKSLPTFNATSNREIKDKIVKSIYSYANKILYAHFKPVDDNIDNLCESILDAINTENITITKKEILNKIINYSQILIIAIYTHFSEMCTSSKTFKKLSDKTYGTSDHQIFQLMIYEQYGDVDLYIKQAEYLFKQNHDILVKSLLQLSIKKYYIFNSHIHKNQQERIIDKFFDEYDKKSLKLLKNKM